MNNRRITDSISIFVSEDGRLTATPHVLNFQVLNEQILTVVYVGTEHLSRREHSRGIHLQTEYDSRPFRALWDTGASRTMVEPRVLERQSLRPEGGVTVRGIDGIESEKPTYRILLILTQNPISRDTPNFPNIFTLHPVVVAKLEEDGQLGGDFDILIGMDIIKRLDFAVSTGNDANLWCSIRHPASGNVTDYDVIP